MKIFALVCALLFLSVNAIASELSPNTSEPELISTFGSVERAKAVLGVCIKVFWKEGGSIGDSASYVFSEKIQNTLAFMMIDGELTKLSRTHYRESAGFRYEQWSAPNIEITLKYPEDKELVALENEGLGEYHFQNVELTIKKGSRQMTVKLQGLIGC